MSHLAFPRRWAIVYFAARAVIAIVLGSGLAGVAGSQAAVVATIAATVILVSVVLSGAVLTWFGVIARIDNAPGAPWATAQGGVVLLVGLGFPILSFPAPLIDTPAAIWYLAVCLAISGSFDLLGRTVPVASVMAGVSQLIVALIMVLLIAVKTEPYLLGFVGPVGYVLIAHAVVLGGAAIYVARRLQ